MINPSLSTEEQDEFVDFRNAALLDTLKVLGPVSQEEYDYYNNLEEETT